MKKGKQLQFIFFLTLSLLYCGIASASHVLGGQITYKCVAATAGPGRYEFTVVVFRDCNGIPLDIAALQLQMQPVAGQPNISQVLPRVLSQDVTLRCATASGFSCDPPATGNGQQGSVAKLLYQGIVDLSGLAAAPPGGYTFFVTTGVGGNTLPCCRPFINNSLASNGNQSLQVKMFRYTDPLTGAELTPAQMCDDSPIFSNYPTALLVINPNDTVYYQNFAIDPNNSDSTSFDLDYPLNQALAPYFYTPPYSLINPLPGLLGPAVVGAANHPINPVSGEIVLSPNQSGTFVTVIKVTSYRCGQKIAEIYRDFSLKIIPLPANYPPVYNLNTPSTNPSYFYQQRPPQIRSELKDAAGNDVFSYKFFANDTVKIKLKVEDILPIYSGNPSDYPNSPLALNGFYTAFNSNQIGFGNNPGACNFPPCMTLRGPNDPPLPAPAITVPTTQFLYPGGPVIGTGFDQRGFTQGGGQISWIPGCNNLLPSDSFSAPANQISKKFLVQATALDLICPIPGLSSKVIEIEIFNLPKLQAPIFRNYHFDEQLNRFSVSFIQPLDTLSVDPIDSINFPNLNQNQVRQISVERRRKSFVSYKLYRAIIPAGSPLLVSGNPVAPFQLVGEIFDIDSTIFLDVAPFNTTLFDYYYFVVNTSTCKELVSTSTDTIRLENPARIEINPFLSSCLDQKTGFGVSLSNFNATLGSMSLVLQYDSTKLRFHSIRNVNPRLTGTFVNNALNNQIRVAWYSTDSIWVNGTMNLFEIIFYSTDTGNISISWNTNETSITDNLGGALSVIGIPITKFFIKCPTYRGSLLYKNSLNSPLINSRIRLQNQGSALFLDTITNTQGNFNFGPVEPGLYNLTFQPNIGWGGVNGTDALLTVLHYVLINPMNGLNLQAADVNYNQLINAADALTMSRRAVGQIGGFMSGDWVYNRSSIQLFPNDTLVLNNILALCYGDVNGSYILNSQPREIFNEIPHLSNISVKSSELQLYLDEPTEIGALTIHLNLPNNTIVGDVVSSCSSGQLVYHQTGQSLKIVWYSAEGCSTKSSEPLLRIKYIGPDPQKLELGSESELANRFGQPIHGVDFRWAGPKTNTQPFVRVYPNPSSDIFYLQGKSPYYQLTDLLGRPILDGFNLNGETQIDLTAKPRGMYLLNLIEENGQKSMHKLILK